MHAYPVGSRPQESKGTVIRIPLDLKSSSRSSDTTETWSAEATVIGGKSLECSVTSAPDSSIGEYRFYVETTLSNNKDSVKRYVEDAPMIILFNAWIKGTKELYIRPPLFR